MSETTEGNMELPTMSEQERLDLSKEAGRDLTTRQAYEYLRRKTNRECMMRMLEG